MKNNSNGIGLYPIIFIIIFIRRYLAGMDITNAHNWIAIAITSFFWFTGIVIGLLAIVGIMALIFVVKK